jgi:hypothetical protein
MIEAVLAQRGGMLSTELKEYLMKACSISSDTARKRISRAEKDNSNICKLLGITFQHRAVFYYHKKNFGSSYYWNDLHQALQESNSVYAYTIAALISHQGIIPIDHFPIQCGAPHRMAKNISYERVLNDLKNINAIQESFIPRVGDCISLIQNDEYNKFDGDIIKARLLSEEILINALSDWLKNLNFASYHSIALNRDEKHHSVNGFYWDISAPSYLTPLTTTNVDGKKPGFIVCDVMLDCIIDENALSPFLNKVKKSQFNRNQGRCLYIFVAERFTNEAFNLAKKAGIMPATVRNLFGKDVEKALKSVISLFSHLASLVDAPDKIDKLFSRLDQIEGAVGNLRGSLFEFIVAESLRSIYPTVELGNKLKSLTSSKKYDADIMVTKPQETLIIECKSGHAGALLDNEEVKHWLQEQVPNMYKTLCHQSDDPERKYVFELWSTKQLSEESIALIDKVKKTLKKYSIELKIGEEVRQEVEKSNKETLVNILNQHYLNKHSL